MDEAPRIAFALLIKGNGGHLIILTVMAASRNLSRTRQVRGASLGLAPGHGQLCLVTGGEASGLPTSMVVREIIMESYYEAKCNVTSRFSGN